MIDCFLSFSIIPITPFRALLCPYFPQLRHVVVTHVRVGGLGYITRKPPLLASPRALLKNTNVFDISTPQKAGAKRRARRFLCKNCDFYDINNEVQKQARRNAAARTTEE
ncbi:hypothetical protein [uncultured Cloacibacillus sp.]|uniref:hypothetical protein n=1 Tax=uncultured Cloacibacillus sp. TaxID=889794 RepID=UPI00320B3F25